MAEAVAPVSVPPVPPQLLSVHANERVQKLQEELRALIASQRELEQRVRLLDKGNPDASRARSGTAVDGNASAATGRGLKRSGTDASVPASEVIADESAAPSATSAAALDNTGAAIASEATVARTTTTAAAAETEDPVGKRQRTGTDDEDEDNTRLSSSVVPLRPPPAIGDKPVAKAIDAATQSRNKRLFGRQLLGTLQKFKKEINAVSQKRKELEQNVEDKVAEERQLQHRLLEQEKIDTAARLTTLQQQQQQLEEQLSAEREAIRAHITSLYHRTAAKPCIYWTPKVPKLLQQSQPQSLQAESQPQPDSQSQPLSSLLQPPTQPPAPVSESAQEK